MLSIQDLTVSVTKEKKEILHDISLDFVTGKIYAVMGPNGSGKSTLALSTIGAPHLETDETSKILLDGGDIAKIKTEDRAKRGLFVSMQNPPALSGVTVGQILRIAVGDKMKPLELRQKIDKTAKELSIPKELLTRSLNDGFSGGERKKMETLQMALLDPKIIFFDEIDTGVDVDALKTIMTFLKDFKTPEKTYIFITHNTRIFDYLEPDEVIILQDGKVAETGEKGLIEKVEKDGYK